MAYRNPKDKSNRKTATQVAVGRAMYGLEVAPPNRWECTYWGSVLPVSEIVEEAVNKMRERAKKYFK